MDKQYWDTEIKPKTGWFDLNLKEVIKYRDLISLFVKRDIVTRYKQTVLGPLWLVITPLLSTFISTFVFGTIAGIETGTIPYALFYFCGFTAWSYFASCITATASTFTANAGIFGKVYFPRLTMPISSVISSLINFAVQFVMMIGFMILYGSMGADVSPVWSMMWLLPLLIAEMALLGLGCGIILSSVTTKYRDLSAVVGLGIDMWKYITPVIYTVSSVEGTLGGVVSTLCIVNPMSAIVETFRYVCLGSGGGTFMPGYLVISFAETLVVLFFGIVLFNRVEKTFMDTV